MQYLLLIYTEEWTQPPSDEEIGAQMAAYNAFTDEIRAKGVMRGGEALQPTTTATTVRVRDGEIVTTDGPYAETKEALGGYYLVEAADLDEAIEYAAKIPGARSGAIEVRPIVDFAALETAGAGGAVGSAT